MVVRRQSVHSERTLMRRLLWLWLISGSALLAQQSAEWQPSVADDNKTATWEDTSGFIVNTLNHFSSVSLDTSAPSRCHLNVSGSGSNDSLGLSVSAYDGHSLKIDAVIAKSFAEQIGLQPGMRILAGEARGKTRQFRTPDDFRAFEAPLRSGDRVVLAIHDEHPNSKIKSGPGGFGNAAGVLTAIGGSYTVDFSKVDPLTVVVRAQTVSFSGSMNGTFAIMKSGENSDLVPSAQPLLWSVSDSEMSKRLARAVLHVALLCGGTKSVSPF